MGQLRHQARTEDWFGPALVPHREHVGGEGIVLPLSADGALVDMLLGAIVFKIGSPHDS